MKALAATSVRQYEKAAESLDDYFQTVQMGLSVVLSAHTEILVDPALEEDRPVLALVFGSDHGLVGRFNEQIVSYALEEYWTQEEPEGAVSPEDRIIVAAGEQVAGRLIAAGIRPADVLGMPTSIGGITPFVQHLLEKIEQWRFREGVERVLLLYNRPLTGGFRPNAETLLPVRASDLQRSQLPWLSRSLPTFTMAPDRLLSALMGQYFFASLYRASALSLAAENASRLAAMQAAEQNIEERLDALKTAFQSERQTSITGELLEIISGFRSVRRWKDPS